MGRRLRDPLQVCRLAESAEATHFWAAVLVMLYICYAFFSRQWSVVADFLVQVVGNIYPIMHLRLVRGRLTRLIARGEAKRAHQPLVHNST